MTIDKLQTMRDIVEKEQRQIEMRFNFLSGKIAILDELMREAKVAEDVGEEGADDDD